MPSSTQIAMMITKVMAYVASNQPVAGVVTVSVYD